MRKKTKRKVAAGVGAGLALVAAAATSAYFLSGRRGVKYRRKLKSWAHNARKEATAAVKKLKKVDRKNYNKAIELIGRKYKRVKSIDPKEVEQIVKEIKGHWKKIQKELKKKPARKPARRVVRRKPAKRRTTKRRTRRKR